MESQLRSPRVGLRRSMGRREEKRRSDGLLCLAVVYNCVLSEEEDKTEVDRHVTAPHWQNGRTQRASTGSANIHQRTRSRRSCRTSEVLGCTSIAIAQLRRAYDSGEGLQSCHRASIPSIRSVGSS